jgi:hypothetical protein
MRQSEQDRVAAAGAGDEPHRHRALPLREVDAGQRIELADRPVRARLDEGHHHVLAVLAQVDVPHQVLERIPEKRPITKRATPMAMPAAEKRKRSGLRPISRRIMVAAGPSTRPRPMRSSSVRR